MENDRFQVFLAVWAGKFLDNQVLRQVKDCVILELHEIVKTPHMVCVPNQIFSSFVIEVDTQDC